MVSERGFSSCSRRPAMMASLAARSIGTYPDPSVGASYRDCEKSAAFSVNPGGDHEIGSSTIWPCVPQMAASIGRNAVIEVARSALGAVRVPEQHGGLRVHARVEELATGLYRCWPSQEELGQGGAIDPLVEHAARAELRIPHSIFGVVGKGESDGGHDVSHLADRALLDQLHRPTNGWVEPGPHRFHQEDVGVQREPGQCARLPGGHRQRLLDDDMLPGLHGHLGHGEMFRMRCGDVDHVDVGRGPQIVELDDDVRDPPLCRECLSLLQGP